MEQKQRFVDVSNAEKLVALATHTLHKYDMRGFSFVADDVELLEISQRIADFNYDNGKKLLELDILKKYVN